MVVAAVAGWASLAGAVTGAATDLDKNSARSSSAGPWRSAALASEAPRAPSSAAADDAGPAASLGCSSAAAGAPGPV